MADEVEVVPEVVEPEEFEPLTLTKDGNSETFKLADDIPSILLLEMGAIANGHKSDGNGEFVVLIWELLKRSFPDDEYHRFRNWTMDVDAEIKEIVGWIGEAVGVISDRPTKGQSSLPDGLPETNTGSTGPGEPEPETSPDQGSSL